MHMGRRFAAPALALAATFAATSASRSATFQEEQAVTCSPGVCVVTGFSAVPKKKRLLLTKVSCEFYVSRGIEASGLNRAEFYVFGTKGAEFTPRHRFIQKFELERTFNNVNYFNVSLSETPTLELRAGMTPVIEAKGGWSAGSGACTLVGELTAQ